jgi:alpha-1,6-mannosyltransferase
LRLVDVAPPHDAQPAGLGTYLDAKAAWAACADDIEHHVLVREAARRLPFRGKPSLGRILNEIHPDVVVIHDPLDDRSVEGAGDALVAVHHGSSLTIPAPRAQRSRPGVVPLRPGLDPAFRPRAGVSRGDHVLHVGPPAREGTAFALLEAAVRSPDAWPLCVTGSGPARRAIAARAQKLRIALRVSARPPLRDRSALAHLYARSACVVVDGGDHGAAVALQAAACAALIVAPEGSPAAAVAGDLCETHDADDLDDLVAAIDRARRRPRDHERAARLVWRHAWAHCFAGELESLRAAL